VYRTLDTYIIKPRRAINHHEAKIFGTLLEECNLMADYRKFFDVLTHRNLEFTASCTYTQYKKFFCVFFEVFGAFAAEVSFTEDYPPEGCGYNTMVNFQVDSDGKYVFALVNVLVAGENVTASEEYEKRRLTPNPPFEPNCNNKGEITDWDECKSHGDLNSLS
jgi:hypothetical protein